MPQIIGGAGRDHLVGRRLLVELLKLLGADDANLEVVAAEVTLRVEDGVDVEAGSLWSARELTEPEDQLLLEFVGEVVLGTEENNATLGDCCRSVCVSRLQ